MTSMTLPLAALTAFSNTGVSCLQCPHHSAQKSTSTGCFIDSWITSCAKVCVVVSLTRPSVPAVSPFIVGTRFRYGLRWVSCAAVATAPSRARDDLGAEVEDLRLVTCRPEKGEEVAHGDR